MYINDRPVGLAARPACQTSCSVLILSEDCRSSKLVRGTFRDRWMVDSPSLRIGVALDWLFSKSGCTSGSVLVSLMYPMKIAIAIVSSAVRASNSIGCVFVFSWVKDEWQEGTDKEKMKIGWKMGRWEDEKGKKRKKLDGFGGEKKRLALPLHLHQSRMDQSLTYQWQMFGGRIMSSGNENERYPRQASFLSS